jgi:hypothetical protein
MNQRILQIHERIEHDHSESCNLYELIEQIVEANAYLNANETLNDMFGVEGLEQ